MVVDEDSHVEGLLQTPGAVLELEKYSDIFATPSGLPHVCE